MQGGIYDRADPWLGDPALINPTCAFHQFRPGGCTGCQAGETCSIDGTCVPAPRTLKDVVLTVTVGSARREYAADRMRGGIYSPIDIGGPGDSFAMSLRFGDYEVRLDPMPVAGGALSNLEFKVERPDDRLPGALDVTWSPSGEGAMVRTTIPINHHAAVPTFTACAARDTAGAIHADAEMIDPLAVETGLELQDLEHMHVAAAQTPAGCIEFQFGARIPIHPR